MIIIFALVIWLMFYTPIINKILFPNGKKAFEILYKLSTEEFGKNIEKCKSYLDLKKEIMISLEKINEQEFDNYELTVLIHIEHMNQNDFGSYMSMKFAYWAVILATLSTIYDGNIFEVIGLSKFLSLCITLLIFTIFLLFMGHQIRQQHNCLEYLKFKLICINAIKDKKEKWKNNTYRVKNKNNV